MISMQDKIITAICETAENDLGLEVAQRAEYANTGRLFVQRGLDTWLILRYSFHADYFSLDLLGAAVTAASVTDNPPVWRVEAAFPGEVKFHALRYADGDRIRALLDLIRNLLTPYAAHKGTPGKGDPR